MHELTKEQARRIAVRAQPLEASRPIDLAAIVRQLTLLQIDPTAAIAPSADLVAWSRLGSSYRPEHLKRALEQDRTLFEHNALIRSRRDMGQDPPGCRDRRDRGDVLDGDRPARVSRSARRRSRDRDRRLVTITTTGFGDLAPASDLGRALASVEVVFGQLYLTTVVAVIVAAAARARRAPRPDDSAT
ncbi:MAG TPA: ion channel [Gaiellaceae bacterium]|nr:ion channel [Gaiellaceae bacterium]